MKKSIIELDAGHGGKDPGTVGNGLQEKNVVLDLTLRVGKLLTAMGADVRYTRTTDVFIDLSERARIANQHNADLFVSLHGNSGTNAQGVPGSGFESYIHDSIKGGKTVSIQDAIHQKVAAVFLAEGLRDRGQKRRNFAVLRETKMPAVLLEYGFINNPVDAAFLKDQSFLDRLARATANGIGEALGLQQTEEDKDDITGHWAEKEIRKVIADGKMRGYPDGSFKPDAPLTRAEFATLIANGII
ncbi:hypothetical protein BEP19_15780 [Ammoniphilus oxalaticus]|uniref:SLH domain-containing protein n=2 Tax=Ammoniphilus oxalaticus TaxID=66863 RepID=A0A419SDH1_9BACL|nr:hypothetical protein BEP19_15780 [Ammoniphilus oxalaticus]